MDWVGPHADSVGPWGFCGSDPAEASSFPHLACWVPSGPDWGLWRGPCSEPRPSGLGAGSVGVSSRQPGGPGSGTSRALGHPRACRCWAWPVSTLHIEELVILLAEQEELEPGTYQLAEPQASPENAGRCHFIEKGGVGRKAHSLEGSGGSGW